MYMVRKGFLLVALLLVFFSLLNGVGEHFAKPDYLWWLAFAAISGVIGIMVPRGY